MRLFIFVASFFGAVLANAASINWQASVGSVKHPTTGANLAGATAYLYCNERVSATDVVGAMRAGTWTDAAGYLATNTTTAGGRFSSSEVTLDGSFLDATTYNWYVVITYTDTATGMMYGMVSAVIPQSTSGTLFPAGEVTITAGNVDTSSGGWIAIVPEPTVMALLALGVAGLALRRKIA